VVAHTGEAAGAGAIRALNEPRPINVRAGERGVPLEVQVDGWQRVLAVEERWRLDDEWWRERPVSRVYWRVLLEDGRVATVFNDLVSGRWAQQDQP